MKISKKLQKEITLAVLSMVHDNYGNMSREYQKELYDNMRKAVHKFIVREYHRYNSLNAQKNT
jgi:hypothetical protein